MVRRETARRRLDLQQLMGDPRWHDPELAGWWVWSVCVQIGVFGAGGPWWPDGDGRLVRQPGGWRDGVCREIPNLSAAGRA